MIVSIRSSPFLLFTLSVLSGYFISTMIAHSVKPVGLTIDILFLWVILWCIRPMTVINGQAL